MFPRSKSLTFVNPSVPPPNATKTQVKAYIRHLLLSSAIMPNPFDEDRPANSQSAIPKSSTLQSIASVMTVKSLWERPEVGSARYYEAILGRVWFGGSDLRVLIHVGLLKSELGFLGFYGEVLEWLAGEIERGVRGLDGGVGGVSTSFSD